MTGNNDGDRRVPGTWLVTITGPVSTRAIVTFTRDGGMAERIQGTPEALLGAWEPIPNGFPKLSAQLSGPTNKYPH